MNVETSVRASQLDATSKQIIELLQQDGRKSFSEIGKSVGLSEAAVRQRVQKLSAQRVMQVVAVTDPIQLGFARSAMLGVKSSGDSRKVADAIAELPEVSYVVLTTGSFDLLIEIICEDDDHLVKLVNGKIKCIAGIAAVETFVYLKLHKQQYNWAAK
jgi:Lrp/AsnC family transcriptional regulator for asnA, asnC and gidA